MFSCFPSLPRPSTFCNLSLLDEIRRNKLASFKVQIFTYSPKHHECSRRLISLMAHHRSLEPFGGIFYTFAHMFEFAAKHDIKPFIRHLIRNKLSKGWFINCAFFTKALTEICQESLFHKGFDYNLPRKICCKIWEKKSFVAYCCLSALSQRNVIKERGQTTHYNLNYYPDIAIKIREMENCKQKEEKSETCSIAIWPLVQSFFCLKPTAFIEWEKTKTSTKLELLDLLISHCNCRCKWFCLEWYLSQLSVCAVSSCCRCRWRKGGN